MPRQPQVFRECEVIVQDVGRVHAGRSQQAAKRAFHAWCLASRREEGRASGKIVDLYEDGNVVKTFDPNEVVNEHVTAH